MKKKSNLPLFNTFKQKKPVDILSFLFLNVIYQGQMLYRKLFEVYFNAELLLASKSFVRNRKSPVSSKNTPNYHNYDEVNSQLNRLNRLRFKIMYGNKNNNKKKRMSQQANPNPVGGEIIVPVQLPAVVIVLPVQISWKTRNEQFMEQFKHMNPEARQLICFELSVYRDSLQQCGKDCKEHQIIPLQRRANVKREIFRYNRNQVSLSRELINASGVIFFLVTIFFATGLIPLIRQGSIQSQSQVGAQINLKSLKISSLMNLYNSMVINWQKVPGSEKDLSIMEAYLNNQQYLLQFQSLITQINNTSIQNIISIRNITSKGSNFGFKFKNNELVLQFNLTYQDKVQQLLLIFQVVISGLALLAGIMQYGKVLELSFFKFISSIHNYCAKVANPPAVNPIAGVVGHLVVAEPHQIDVANQIDVKKDPNIRKDSHGQADIQQNERQVCIENEKKEKPQSIDFAGNETSITHLIVVKSAVSNKLQEQS